MADEHIDQSGGNILLKVPPFPERICMERSQMDNVENSSRSATHINLAFARLERTILGHKQFKKSLKQLSGGDGTISIIMHLHMFG